MLYRFFAAQERQDKKSGLPKGSPDERKRIVRNSSSVMEKTCNKIVGIAQSEDDRLMRQIDDERMSAQEAEEGNAFFEG